MFKSLNQKISMLKYIFKIIRTFTLIKLKELQIGKGVPSK